MKAYSYYPGCSQLSSAEECGGRHAAGRLTFRKAGCALAGLEVKGGDKI